MNFDKELTLLSEQEVWGVNGGRQLDVLEKYGTRSAITDLVILTGGYCEDSCSYMAPDDNSLKGRTGWVYTRSSAGDGYGPWHDRQRHGGRGHERRRGRRSCRRV